MDNELENIAEQNFVSRLAKAGHNIDVLYFLGVTTLNTIDGISTGVKDGLNGNYNLVSAFVPNGQYELPLSIAIISSAIIDFSEYRLKRFADDYNSMLEKGKTETSSKIIASLMQLSPIGLTQDIGAAIFEIGLFNLTNRFIGYNVGYLIGSSTK